MRFEQFKIVLGCLLLGVGLGGLVVSFGLTNVLITPPEEGPDWIAKLIAGSIALVCLAALSYLALGEWKEPQRTEDVTLQAYLDYMSGMLTDPDRPLRRSRLGDTLSVAARAQTLTALGRLQDGDRKGSVIQFLYEAGLIKELNNNRPVISLRGADLREANLPEADLQKADLREANFREADLREADLQGANLYGANLQRANLQGANLQDADLYGAYLKRADLQGANLQDADLQRAYLQDADLADTEVSKKQLASALSLEGATMPDGSIQP
jgi:hypothetical protein